MILNPIQVKDIPTAKTTADDADYLLMQNPTSGLTYKITKADLLAGLSSGGSSGSSAPSVITNNLILQVDASDIASYAGTGTTWVDTINANNISLSNCSFDSGDSGSIVFNGSNSVGSFNKPSSIFVGGSITVEIWANWLTRGSTVGDIQCLIDNNSASTGFIIQDFPFSGNILSTPGGNTSFPIGLGEWMHITATVQNNIGKLYVNGELFSSTLGSQSLASVGSIFTLGHWQGGGRYLNGKIGLVRMYSAALSGLQVLNNFNASKARFS